MGGSGGLRAGRSHRARNMPCQDAFAIHEAPDRGRIVAAVADGLGSRPLSHVGSDAACRAAVDTLAAEPVWDRAAVTRAFEAARAAIDSAATVLGARADDLATTLQVVALHDGGATAAMVGDGAIVAVGPDVRVLLEPEDGEYANEVVPLSAPDWDAHLRVAHASEADAALAFTDGLTRLLLHRQEGRWRPYAPFFDAFLPKARAAGFDGGLVARFLESDRVDASWDDDKCLVVMGHDPVRV